MKTIIILFILLSFNLSYSCTTFCIRTNDELVFGRNYDWMIGNGIVFVNKKDVVKSAFTLSNNPAQWISKFGSVTFNQYGREFPTGGINEAGLVVELMWLDETKYPAPDDRPAAGGVLQWIQYQLDNSETVNDVIISDTKIRIPSQAVPIHFLVADKKGNCASIEFLDGKLVAHLNESMAFPVLTNDTYAKSSEHIKNYKDFGGLNEMPDERGSLERFAKACSMLKNYNKEKDRNAVDYGFKILNSVSQGENTKWSIVYDIKNLIIYFKTFDNSNQKNIVLAEFDFNCLSDVKMLDVDIDYSGNVNSQFKDYTYEANRKLIEDSYNGVDFLKSATKDEKDMTAKYPEELKCRSKSEIIEIPANNGKASSGLFLPVILAAVILLGAAIFFVKNNLRILQK